MSGYNRFTALIVERDWTTLSYVINEADEIKRREMASQPFNGDLLLHAAIKLEAPKEELLNLLAAYPEAAVRQDKNQQSTLELAYDHSIDDEVIHVLKKYCKTRNRRRSLRRSVSEDRVSFSAFIDQARLSLLKQYSEKSIF